MDGQKEYKKRYKAAFDRLSYQNKVTMNNVSDYVEDKKLNKLAEQRLMADVADMVLGWQERNEPAEQMIGNDIHEFCDKLCMGAPLESACEKVLSSVRKVTEVFFDVSIVCLAFSLTALKSIYLVGIYSLQITAGMLVAILGSFGILYRGGMYMPVNIIFAKRVPSAGTVVKMIIYSAVSIAIAVAYVIAFILNYDTLIGMGLDSIRINVLAFTLVCGAVYLVSFICEKSAIKRGFMNCFST